MSLSPEQMAAIKAAVADGIAQERAKAAVGLGSAVPRGVGAAPPAAIQLAPPAAVHPHMGAGEHHAHPSLASRVIKAPVARVDHLTGEIRADHGQRIGRRVYVLHYAAPSDAKSA